jgi:hypothetical protein
MKIFIHNCHAEKLIDMIQAHRYLYYEMTLPVISDADYDQFLCAARQAISDPLSPIALHAPGQKDFTDPPEYTERQKLLAQHFLQVFYNPPPCYG